MDKIGYQLSKFSSLDRNVKIKNPRTLTGQFLTPAALAPPRMRYSSEQGYNTELSGTAQGRYGGTGTVPSVILPAVLIS